MPSNRKHFADVRREIEAWRRDIDRRVVAWNNPRRRECLRCGNSWAWAVDGDVLCDCSMPTAYQLPTPQSVTE